MTKQERNHRRNEVTAMAAVWLLCMQAAVGAGVAIAILKQLIR